MTPQGARGRSGLRPLLIGLTGPIGCGKSTVAGWLADDGGVVVDADAIARDVTAPGEPALDRVIERFGQGLRRPDGTLDRAALGRIVFSDAAALRDLERIVHPAVQPRIEAAVAAAERSGAELVVVEAIKLVEAGYAAQCDEIWLVVCDADAQRERLRGRGLTDSDARERIEAQGDLARHLGTAASRIVDASGPADAVRATVAEFRAAAMDEHRAKSVDR
jgi:dephospho-CoA kinase